MPGQMTGRTSSYRAQNSTAERTLEILNMFGESRSVVTAVEVAEHLDVARSTAYRYIQSLVSSSYLEDDASGGFRIGRRVIELARTARRGLSISEISRPVMRRLASDTREVVLLTRLAGDAVVCLERADVARRAVRISYEPGEIFPTNAGSAAYVLLAWLDETELSSILKSTKLRRFTPATLTTPATLRERLNETRAQGFAVSRGELDADVLGIAAPIFSLRGRVVAAITVAALSSRIGDSEIPAITASVLSAAAQISSVFQREEQ